MGHNRENFGALLNSIIGNFKSIIGSGLVDFRFEKIRIVLEVLHISYNIGTCALPDIYALALGCCVYISGKALLPML